MEGLTLAKRGGSPCMLQRLVKISLIRRDFALADKYLDILGRLPGYRRWRKNMPVMFFILKGSAVKSLP